MSPGPSSLLPSQSSIPPTSYRSRDDTGAYDENRQRKRKSVLGRPLKWVISNERRTSGSSSSSSGSGNGNDSGGSRSSGPIQREWRPTSSSSPRLLFGSPKPSTPKAETPELANSSPAMTVPVSANVIKPYTPPSLGSLPPPPFGPYILHCDEDESHNQGLAAWPGLGPMPLPSPSELSSTHIPDELLNPMLASQTGVAMRSTSAFSFRDDMDYSRPIGGVSARPCRRTIHALIGFFAAP